MDVTSKYKDMIEAFECDFSLSKNEGYNLNNIQKLIDEKDEHILNDISLLEELSFYIRNNKIKLILE